MYSYSRRQTSSLALPHPPSRPPRHDQDEISGLSLLPFNLYAFKVNLYLDKLFYIFDSVNVFFQDWSSNHGNVRSQSVLVLLRIAQWFDRFPVCIRWIGFPYFLFYHLFVVWILGIELHYKAKIGSGLRLFHGVATVIHESVVIGKNCSLRHSTTIGMRHENEAVPILGDNVDIGCQSVIIGPIHIGNGAVIGAGSVVLHDIPAHAVVAGNPARIL